MIFVVGAGNFGTAIGCLIARNGYDVTLLSRNPDKIHVLNTSKTLPGYPDIIKPTSLNATLDIHRSDKAEAVILGVPTQNIREFLERHGHLFANKPVLLLQKGIEKESGLLGSQVVSNYVQGSLCVLSGPNFAHEILYQCPTATVIASHIEHAALKWSRYLKSDTFYPYTTSDMIGVQLGGAVKNVIAIACGIIKGLNLGENTLSAVLTQGIQEMVSLGHAMGAKSETFLGLSGIGDLTLTCYGQASRNIQFGKALAEKKLWDHTEKTVEGYYTAMALEHLRDRYHVVMPLCTSILDIINGKLAPENFVSMLMNKIYNQEVSSCG